MSIDEATSLMDLPSPILFEILSRLPPTTLLYIKSVSKSFLNLTLDSEFLKLSRSTSPAGIIINQYSLDEISTTNTLKFLKFENQDTDHSFCLDPNVDLDLQLYFPVDTFWMIGSVHGFVCFNYFPHHDRVDTIYILNPRTREYIILPEAEGVRGWPNGIVTYGFGFDPVRFEYKVVRIYQEKIYDDYYKSKGQVYTIGKGYWRNAGHVMFSFMSDGVNLYAKIHWLVYDANGNELICSFDFENELFESFPTSPWHTKKNCPNLRTLGVYGRCLCVCDNYAYSHFEVW